MKSQNRLVFAFPLTNNLLKFIFKIMNKFFVPGLCSIIFIFSFTGCTSSCSSNSAHNDYYYDDYYYDYYDYYNTDNDNTKKESPTQKEETTQKEDLNKTDEPVVDTPKEEITEVKVEEPKEEPKVEEKEEPIEVKEEEPIKEEVVKEEEPAIVEVEEPVKEEEPIVDFSKTPVSIVSVQEPKRPSAKEMTLPEPKPQEPVPVTPKEEPKEEPKKEEVKIEEPKEEPKIAEVIPEPVVEPEKTEEDKEYERSVANMDSTVSKEEFAEDKAIILEIIEELDSVMRYANYKKWITYVDDESIRYWSKKQNLQKASSRLPGNGIIRLNTLEDYFKYVFIPARKGRAVDEIRYETPTSVKVVQVNGNMDIIYYSFYKINNEWKIHLPPLND